MSSLFLTHSPADGTILAGTTQGDGAAAVLKGLSWRWSRQMDSWYIPESRDRHPQQNLIAKTTARLEALGMSLDIDVTEGVRSAEDIETDRNARSAARLQRLEAAATGARQTSERAAVTARVTALRLSTAQPILVGHPSEKALRRHYDTVEAASRRSVDADAKVEAAEATSRAGKAAAARKDDPAFAGRQVLKLEADLRSITRHLEGSSRRLSNGTIETTTPAIGQRRADLQEQRAALEDFLNYWKTRQKALLAESGKSVLSKETVAAGDAVKHDDGWYRVVRANAQSVTVSLGWGATARFAYDTLQDHNQAPSGK